MFRTFLRDYKYKVFENYVLKKLRNRVVKIDTNYTVTDLNRDFEHES